MYLKPKLFSRLLLPIFCAVTVGFGTLTVNAQIYSETPVNIFGDGDQNNGVEDNRLQILNGRQQNIRHYDWRMNAGTLKCDGKIRGTAMVINTQEFAPGLNGVVLASAAHVLFNLGKKTLFRRCDFHFMALGKRSKYRVKIDLVKTLMGNYDPSKPTNGASFGEGDWAFLYVAKPWKGYESAHGLTPRDYPFPELDSHQRSNGAVNLIAYDTSVGAISVSQDCAIVESRKGDLGGGSWAGQLLDNCDSSDGASGGGIVAEIDGKQYLVGIRNGSHWDDQVYPVNQYPDGPPDGAVWDAHSNTNFGRAIDTQIMHLLQQFTLNLEQAESGF